MKLVLLLTFSSLTITSAAADILTLQQSNELYTLTGLGTNATGAGTARVTFGSCKYDGSVTKCTVTGNYTGLGGGTYQFLLTYPGNGISPLQTVASPPGSNNVYFNLLAGSLTFSIMPSSGGTFSFDPLSFNLFYDFTATCTGTTNCSVGGVGVTPNATITGKVNGQFDPTPMIKSLVTATGYGGSPAIAPATWVEIYGTNLSTTARLVWGGADFNGAQAPTALGGTTVKIAGQSAFVDFVSPNQVNAQIPSNIPLGQQSVVITTAGGASVGTTVTVNAVQPGILAPAVFNVNGVQYAVALFPDGATYVLPPQSGIPTRRAKPGDTIVLYGVGFGPVSPNINAGLIVGQANTLSGVQFSIGGKPATLAFAGLVSGFLGLYQFNLVVPAITASDSTVVTFSINGNTGTQMLYLPISN